jgi:hypothetical protein
LNGIAGLLGIGPVVRKGKLRYAWVAIRRTKVGHQQIQRHNEMALSPSYAVTRIAMNIAKLPELTKASDGHPGI